MSGIPIGVSPLVGKWVKKSAAEGGGKETSAKRDVDSKSKSKMRTVKLDLASFSRMEKRYQLVSYFHSGRTFAVLTVFTSRAAAWSGGT